MNSNTNTHTAPRSTATQQQQQPSAAAPKAGRRRKDARYDLPVLRPSMSRAQLARLTV